MNQIDPRRAAMQKIAAETIDIIVDGGYPDPSSNGDYISIWEQTKLCVQDSRLYTPDNLQQLPTHRTSQPSLISVTVESTLDACQRLAAVHGQGVMALNFASAHKPGGGFLNGAQAQEESLARASALYASLRHCDEFYRANGEFKSALYTDHMIWSPSVPVFRDNNGNLLSRPYTVSMLTAPAPNASEYKGPVKDLLNTFRRRIRYIVSIAVEQQCYTLVLGAWGCGVFGNDPEMVAKLFKEELSYPFKSVFAIYDKPNGPTVSTFQRVLGRCGSN